MTVESDALTQLTTRIAAGENVDQRELLPFLMAQSTADRQRANLTFAKAYADAGNVAATTVLARRAFDLGDFDGEAFNFLYAALLAQNRLEELLEMIREAMIMAVESGNTHVIFDLYGCFTGLISRWPSLPTPRPDPHSDRIIAWVMERIFGVAPPPLATDVLSGRRIRVGVMLAGEGAEESALVRAALGFARHCDKSRFEVFVYAYTARADAAKSNPKFESWITDFESWGCVFHEGIPGKGLAKILATQKLILMDRLDVLVFNMLISDYHVLALMRPAPVIVGAIHGNPKGYSMRYLDGTLATDAHSHMESLSDCHFLTPAIDFDALIPTDLKAAPLTKAALNIPADAVVVMSAGRHYKFNNLAFWQALARVLAAQPSAYWVVSGIEADHLKTRGITLAPGILERVRFVPWRTDFVWNVLPLADVLVDTFPGGGAFVVFWAMRIAKPCVSFRSNYMRQFHQLDWSPAFRVVGREDLALPHGDIDALVRRVEQLIRDPVERKAFGEVCKASVATLDDHVRYAREMGDALVDIIKRKQAKTKTPGP